MKTMSTRTVIKLGNIGFAFFILFFNLCMPNAYAYPEPQFRNAMVFSVHNDGGSTQTILFAIIRGPSPLDVSSFTVAKGVITSEEFVTKLKRVQSQYEARRAVK